MQHVHESIVSQRKIYVPNQLQGRINYRKEVVIKKYFRTLTNIPTNIHRLLIKI